MSIRDANAAALSEIRRLFGRANDAPYDLTVVAEEKCFGAGVSGPPRVRVFEEEGAIRGVAVTCGRYLRILAVDREHRRRGIGTALLEDSGARLVGAEPGNYFVPGAPDPEFFLRRGFREKDVAWNLHVDLRAHRPDSSPSSRLGMTNRAPMLAFIEEHFGVAWAFEAERAAIAHYIPGTAIAVAEANNRGLGTFGPAGVAESARGHGFGKRLLLACLADLRDAGHERAIIPWAAAIDFYRTSCGAEPAHRFSILERL